MIDQDQDQDVDPDQDPDSGSDTGDDAGTSQHVIARFPQYFQRYDQNNWGWIAVAAMIGNYYGTGPLEHPRNKLWTQSALATRLCNGRNISGNPDASLANAFVDNPADTNDPAQQRYAAVRMALKRDAPVVIAWLNKKTSVALPGFVLAVYGYSGAKWYFANPSQLAVTQNAALPAPPKGYNLKFFYTRKPPMGKPPS